MYIRKLLVLVFVLVLGMLLPFGPPTNAFSADFIRVSGFTYPRSEFPLFDENGIASTDSFIGASNLIGQLDDANNFGASGAIPCSLNYQTFVTDISTGSLVDGSGNLLSDIFFAGDINNPLTTVEAKELKKFIEAGGVVHISGAFENASGTRYNNLFVELGVGDRFDSIVDFSSFEGESSDPLDTVVTNGIFGSIGPMTHAPFNPIDTFSLTALADGFETGGIVVFAVTPGGGLSDEVVLAEGVFGDGYLSVAGTPMYTNNYTGLDFDNMNYFLNLFALGCGSSGGGSGAPTPFLDLPWDYADNGLSFSKAALRINSYFDHEYPFLSKSLVLSEPDGAKGSVKAFDTNTIPVDVSYSTHDGYDWGRAAKALIREPVLAAAAGTATFSDDCSPCGNAIFIDHGNGYQTRYYHLLDSGLIVNQKGISVQVIQGQQIARVGFSGRTFPAGEGGAHVHFMVVQDKNNDGNFEDNIPDGLVDPFGWQSTDPDPWPNYTFNYRGQDRTGNVSYYLWEKEIANLSNTLPSNGGFYSLEGFGLDFPQNAVSNSATVNMSLSPSTTVSTNMQTLEPILNVNVVDANGAPITLFSTPFTISIDFGDVDISKLLSSSISIYSSQDGTNWVAENTSVDFSQKIASAQVNHLSKFALAAERLDTTPPFTTAVLEGSEGEDNWFRSDVSLYLDAIDNEGGLGVDYIVYAVGDGGRQEYTSPLEFSNEGRYSVFFYSVDNDDNIEETRQVDFRIDKTPPEAIIKFDPESNDLMVTSQDDEDSVSITKKKRGATNFILSDSAGNTLNIFSTYISRRRRDTLRIRSLIYNEEIAYEISANIFTTNYRKGKFFSLNQAAYYNHSSIRISYSGRKNKSKIVRVGEEVVRKKEDGLKLLFAKTSNGTLEFGYE